MKQALHYAFATWGLLLGLLTGCGGPSVGDIAKWKTTAQGTERLAKVLKGPRTSVPVKAETIVALVERGAVDRMAGAVAGMPLEERAQLILATAPRLTRVLGAPQPQLAWDAREALFALRRLATTDEARQSIDTVLFPTWQGDLRAGRTEGGRYTLAEMLTALGAASVPTLLLALEDLEGPYAPAYEVLDRVGDAAARERGGAALARRARQASPVPEPLWDALGTLGGPDVVAFLKERIANGSPEEQERASGAASKLRPEPTLLAFALETARRGDASRVVRERMLEVARKVGGEGARAGILELLAREKDAAFRYQLFETALGMAGGKVLLAALEAFPVRAIYKPEDIQRHLVDPIYKLGYENREGLFKALQSKSAFARMAAVLTLEKSGFGSDAEHLRKLARDRAALKGFPARRTVGAEATRVAAALKAAG